MNPRLTKPTTSASVDPATLFGPAAAPVNTGRVVAVGMVVLTALVTATTAGVTVIVIVTQRVAVAVAMTALVDVETTSALVIVDESDLVVTVVDVRVVVLVVVPEVMILVCTLTIVDLVDIVEDLVEDLVEVMVALVEDLVELLTTLLLTDGCHPAAGLSSFLLKCCVDLDEVEAGIMADMALLEELMVALLDDIIIDELILELILELIIVAIVDMGAIPAVTVIVIVHGAVETTFMTGAINMHVESGGAAIFEEDIIIICAFASDAAARAVAVWVILTILEGRDVWASKKDCLQ